MASFTDKLPVSRFLVLREQLPVVDVRSPGEFAAGHIPGAVNIPLFDDAERAEVGTIYRHKGNLQAVLRGIDLAAPSFSGKLERALELSGGGRLLLHCWRGGMRSEAMAWLFSLGKIEPLILEGGYKAYRNHILEELGSRRRYIILGGLTGSGKTAILRQMRGSGAQVTDLEGLASHRGSAFGALGQAPQPSSEHFANLLYDDLSAMSRTEPVWLEDESRNIGTVFMPDSFYRQMQESPLIALMMDIETRLPRLIREYTLFPAGQIIAAVMKISKRLGGERTAETVSALRKDDYATAVRIILGYYDKAYLYGLKKRAKEKVIYIKTETDDEVINAWLVSEAASAIRFSF